MTYAIDKMKEEIFALADALKERDETIRSLRSALEPFAQRYDAVAPLKANPSGADVWFLSDGGYDCREGSYVCAGCLAAMLDENRTAGAKHKEGLPHAE